MSGDILSRTSPSRGDGRPEVVGFHDAATGGRHYICICPETRKVALLDVVRTRAPKSFATGYAPGHWALDCLQNDTLTLDRSRDTHDRADHLMAGAWLEQKTGVCTGMGKKLCEIAELWRQYCNLPDAFPTDGEFDRLFADQDRFGTGKLRVTVMLSPGQTPGAITHLVGDAVRALYMFMMPDGETSRIDCPGGGSEVLYNSIMAMLEHPDDSRVFIGRDNGTEDRGESPWESTASPQVTESDVATLTTEGCKAIICRRPDRERADQPSFDQIEAAAPTADPETRHLPVQSGMVRDEHVGAFSGTSQTLPCPALACCRTGTRSATLWSFHQASMRPIAEILEATSKAGDHMMGVARHIANGGKTPAATGDASCDVVIGGADRVAVAASFKARSQGQYIAVIDPSDIAGGSASAIYDGYRLCRLAVDCGKVVLAGYGYGRALQPSFPSVLIDCTRLSHAARQLMRKLLPQNNWKAMLKGRGWLAKPQQLWVATD